MSPDIVWSITTNTFYRDPLVTMIFRQYRPCARYANGSTFRALRKYKII